jgi:hypothetical protein
MTPIQILCEQVTARCLASEAKGERPICLVAMLGVPVYLWVTLTHAKELREGLDKCIKLVEQIRSGGPSYLSEMGVSPGRLKEKLEEMPLEVQREMWGSLHKALMWRGWDRKCGCHACDGIREIGRIFSKNGWEIQEYT